MESPAQQDVSLNDQFLSQLIDYEINPRSISTDGVKSRIRLITRVLVYIER